MWEERKWASVNKGVVFKTCSLGRDNCSTCTARTGNTGVASLTIALGAPWWSRVAQPTCNVDFSRVFGGEGCLAAAAAAAPSSERETDLKVCVPLPLRQALVLPVTGLRAGSPASSLLSVCVVEASLSVCPSVCCCACSGYVDSSLLRLLQPLGLLLQRR